MTEYMIRVGEPEAERIYSGDQRFIVRADRMIVFKGDTISFQTYKNTKPIYHPVNRKKFKVSYIADSNEMPVVNGARFIGFREVTI